MSYASRVSGREQKRWFLKKTIWIIIFLGAVSGYFASIYVLSNTPDVGGGLTIESEPDTRIYVGHRLVGTGKVFLSWPDIVGDGMHEPFGEQLHSPLSGV